MELTDLIQVELVDINQVRLAGSTTTLPGRVLGQETFSANIEDYSDDKRNAHFSKAIPEGANAYIIGSLGNLGTGQKAYRIHYYRVDFGQAQTGPAA